MTRRERMEARLERRREWAESRDKKAAAGFRAASAIADNIPLGQPILVGHHSERHARRDVERIDNGMRRGCDSQKMAEHHRGVASTLEHRLETTIFSDDPDAIEAIEAKIADLEAKCAKWKAINVAFRKAKGIPGWAAKVISDPDAAAKIEARWERTKVETPWVKAPVAPYQLTNARSNIRRLADRIKSIRGQMARTEKAETAGGVLIVRFQTSCSITFAEKPPYTLILELKAAGFFWSGGGWHGSTDRIPTAVLAMVPASPAGE
jgi:hypothetical protein